MEYNYFMYMIANFYFQYIKYCIKHDYPKMAFRISEIGNKIADDMSISLVIIII
jgi:hypothetical protein